MKKTDADLEAQVLTKLNSWSFEDINNFMEEWNVARFAVLVRAYKGDYVKAFRQIYNQK